jgi:peroxiredoxin
MAAYNRVLPELAALDAQVVGISVDSPYSHIAWQQRLLGILNFPLACDFYPHGAVAQTYGVFRTAEIPLPGINERTVFVVDKQGVIAMAEQYHLGEQPENEDVFRVLRRLQANSAAVSAAHEGDR